MSWIMYKIVFICHKKEKKISFTKQKKRWGVGRRIEGPSSSIIACNKRTRSAAENYVIYICCHAPQIKRTGFFCFSFLDFYFYYFFFFFVLIDFNSLSKSPHKHFFFLGLVANPWWYIWSDFRIFWVEESFSK